MSLENNISSLTILNKLDKKKTICGGCESELEPDHGGIQCVQAHHYCTDCSVHIVNLFFSEPHNYAPLRCVQCRVDLNPVVFERQLSTEQLEFYNQHMLSLIWAKELVCENERLDHCPFCTYAVIRDKTASNRLHCDHPRCGKLSCLICRKACPQIVSDYVTEEVLEEMEKHFTCDDLATDKEKFERYIELGQKIPCPNCGLAGMKDDSCTHMTCPTCSQLWCYFCGKKVEDCDKEGRGVNSIFDHNSGWSVNPNRCPMYLTQLSDVDNRWPDGDENGCLEFLHRKRSLRFLREAFEVLGEERINALDRHFNMLSTCGFTRDEILNENLTILIRQTQRPTRL